MDLSELSKVQKPSVYDQCATILDRIMLKQLIVMRKILYDSFISMFNPLYTEDKMPSRQYTTDSMLSIPTFFEEIV